MDKRIPHSTPEAIFGLHINSWETNVVKLLGIPVTIPIIGIIK